LILRTRKNARKGTEGDMAGDEEEDKAMATSGIELGDILQLCD